MCYTCHNPAIKIVHLKLKMIKYIGGLYENGPRRLPLGWLKLRENIADKETIQIPSWRFDGISYKKYK